MAGGDATRPAALVKPTPVCMAREGVEKDEKEAARWLELAAGKGDLEARAEADAVAGRLAAAEVRTLQDRARAWVAKQ